MKEKNIEEKNIKEKERERTERITQNRKGRKMTCKKDKHKGKEMQSKFILSFFYFNGYFRKKRC